MAAKRGALIVLEGVDKAGKTTQCKKLVQALQQIGHPAEMMRFPDRSTTIGKLISAYLEKKSELEDHTGFSLDWCTKSDVGLPKPDVVLFLRLSPAEAASRGHYGEERYEDAAFQSAVLDRFTQLMEDPSVNWEVVDASGSINDVHDNIVQKSLDAVDAAQTQPLGELWK
nr:thymidylate kinase-like isoform X4 [Nerophis lumbriciformis]